MANLKNKKKTNMKKKNVPAASKLFRSNKIDKRICVAIKLKKKKKKKTHHFSYK